MKFTKEEFNIMVDELLVRKPRSFDMLGKIANKTLKSSVSRWCWEDDFLRGRGYEEDILQEIFIRLVKTTVTSFLLRDGPCSSVNNNPEEFNSWMFVVAKNIKSDYSRKIRRMDFITENIDESDHIDLLVGSQDVYSYDQDLKIYRLNRAFSIVLSANISIYKILTWVAQYIFILELDLTKIESNEVIDRTFANKTLIEMYDMILHSSKMIPWLKFTENQKEKIVAALQRKYDNDRIYGQVKYKEFYMNYRGVASSKKSISDWVNRINNIVRDRLKEESDE